MELFASLVAALLGVLLDRLSTWYAQRKANQSALELAGLKQRAEVDRINQRIDREVANETNLGALLDRL